jgi:hypothetical protein
MHHLSSIICEPIFKDGYNVRMASSALVVVNNGIKAKVKLPRVSESDGKFDTMFLNVRLSPSQALGIKEYHNMSQKNAGYKINLHENFVLTGHMAYRKTEKEEFLEIVDDSTFEVHERLYLGKTAVKIAGQERPIYSVICDQKPRLHVSLTGELYNHLLEDVTGITLDTFIQKLYASYDTGQDVSFSSEYHAKKQLILPTMKGGFAPLVAAQLETLFSTKTIVL